MMLCFGELSNWRGNQIATWDLYREESVMARRVTSPDLVAVVLYPDEVLASSFTSFPQTRTSLETCSS